MQQTQCNKSNMHLSLAAKLNMDMKAQVAKGQPCRCAMSFLQPEFPETSSEMKLSQNKESAFAENQIQIKLIKSMLPSLL